MQGRRGVDTVPRTWYSVFCREADRALERLADGQTPRAISAGEPVEGEGNPGPSACLATSSFAQEMPTMYDLEDWLYEHPVAATLMVLFLLWSVMALLARYTSFGEFLTYLFS